MTCKRWLMGLALVLCFAATDARAKGGIDVNAPPASPEQVQEAIDKAKLYLYSKQKDGNWEEVQQPNANRREHAKVTADQWGGLTALATYALLAAGESPQDPRMKQAIDFLSKADIVGSYALGIRAAVWESLGRNNPKIQALAKNDAKLLLDIYSKMEGPQNKGFFNYTALETDRTDHSCSNYGVLGIWACAQMDVEIPLQFWKDVDAAWRRDQTDEGAWGYETGKKDARFTMTGAGAATLFITQDFLNIGERSQCKGNLDDKAIDKAIEWLGANMKEASGGRSYYGLYNLERVGVAGGYKYFGKVNWFDVGAGALIKSQDKNKGGWGAIPDTSWAILFLVHGHNPVMMNKLRYNIGGDRTNWNQRHRDAANLSKWVSRQTERDLNWQVVGLDVPVDELHDSPILYIAGDQGLVLKDDEVAKLKQFVEEGGIIVANADCNSVGFQTSFKKLGSKMFPDYEWRNLMTKEPDHVIFTKEQFPAASWKNKPVVYALGNFAREYMFLLADDPSKNWQNRAFKTATQSGELICNIFLYSVERKDLRYRGQTHIVRANAKITPKNTIKLARLQYEGNWNPEPGGWRREAAIMHNLYGAALTVDTVALGDGKLLAGGYKAAHLTGTFDFKLKDAQVAELKKFVSAGGTLLIDSCGGGSKFAVAAEALAMTLDPAGKLVTLAADHAALTAAGGKPLKVEYRQSARRVIGNLDVPRVKGLMVKDRAAVVVSDEDLSVGLVGEAVDGIVGYSTASTSEVVSNLLLYSAGIKYTPEELDAVRGIKPASDDKKGDKKDDKKAADSGLGDVFAKTFPDWKLVASGTDMNAGLINDVSGRKNVFITHPPEKDKPAVITRKFTVDKDKKTQLHLVVGHHPDGDWDLIVKVDGKEVLKAPCDKTTAPDGWMEKRIDLTPFGGKKIDIELDNQPTDWTLEGAYWAAIEIEAK